MKVREGQMVRYRAVPCDTPDVGTDLDLFQNYPRERRMRPLMRPALVLRVWDSGDTPCVNLLVYADGDAVESRWRTSVQHVSQAAPNAPAWDFIEP